MPALLIYSSHVRSDTVRLFTVDYYELSGAGDDDVMTLNVTSPEPGMIRRLSERHVAAIVATTSALTLVMLVVAVIVFLRHRRCEC